VAAATIAALRALVDAPRRTPEDAAQVLDEALEFLEAGFEGLQRRERTR